MLNQLNKGTYEHRPKLSDVHCGDKKLDKIVWTMKYPGKGIVRKLIYRESYVHGTRQSGPKEDESSKRIPGIFTKFELRESLSKP